MSQDETTEHIIETLDAMDGLGKERFFRDMASDYRASPSLIRVFMDVATTDDGTVYSRGFRAAAHGAIGRILEKRPELVTPSLAKEIAIAAATEHFSDVQMPAQENLAFIAENFAEAVDENLSSIVTITAIADKGQGVRVRAQDILGKILKKRPELGDKALEVVRSAAKYLGSDDKSGVRGTLIVLAAARQDFMQEAWDILNSAGPEDRGGVENIRQTILRPPGV
jgi:hypothetical protein